MTYTGRASIIIENRKTAECGKSSGILSAFWLLLVFTVVFVSVAFINTKLVPTVEASIRK